MSRIISELQLESFSVSQLPDVENMLLKSIEPCTNKYKKALVIGRFQPLHRGHIFLIKCALSIASSVVICIGSINKKDRDNPFTLAVRKNLLESVLKREKLDIKKIIFSHDSPDDDVWLKEILNQITTVDIVIGNNAWVNSIFQKAGFQTLEIPLLQRDVYEGKKIRNKLRLEGKL